MNNVLNFFRKAPAPKPSMIKQLGTLFLAGAAAGGGFKAGQRITDAALDVTADATIAGIDMAEAGYEKVKDGGRYLLSKLPLRKEEAIEDKSETQVVIKTAEAEMPKAPTAEVPKAEAKA